VITSGRLYTAQVAIPCPPRRMSRVPLLSVRPCRGLVDERFTLFLLQRAPPLRELTVHALHRSEDGDDWEAFGHYVSDAAGAVDGRARRMRTHTHVLTK